MATTTYDYRPHPHIEARRRRGPTKTLEQRRLNNPNPIVRFNARVGLAITVIVGTMWCAYLFTCIALVSLPDAIKSGQPIIIVAWVAQTFLQLVLLPIIIVGQNIQAKAADVRAEETYHDADAVLHEAQQIQKHLAAQDELIDRILEHVDPTAGPSAPALAR
jgi:hypothetical protein